MTMSTLASDPGAWGAELGASGYGPPYARMTAAHQRTWVSVHPLGLEAITYEADGTTVLRRFGHWRIEFSGGTPVRVAGEAARQAVDELDHEV